MLKELNKSGLLLLALLLGIAAVTTWLRNRSGTEGVSPDPLEIPQVEFFLENFRILQFNEQGRKHYTLEGKRLNHFADTEQTEIQQPEFVLNAEDDDPSWIIQAEQAIASPEEQDEIRFQGNVRIRQLENGAQNATFIHSESMLLKPQAQQLESLTPVTINSTAGSIEAAFLKTDLKTGIHTLTRAKARYAP